MLKHQYPWGRQRGGGAPKVSPSGTMNARIGKFDFRSNTDTTNDCSYNPFGRPGGGAPIKSNSGKCVTALVGDPNIRFQKQFKKEIDQTLVIYICNNVLLLLLIYCYCYYIVIVINLLLLHCCYFRGIKTKRAIKCLVH